MVLMALENKVGFMVGNMSIKQKHAPMLIRTRVNMLDKVIKPCKSNLLIRISSLRDCNHLSSQKVIAHPTLHNLFPRADKNKWYWRPTISADGLDNSDRLSILRARGIQLLHMSWHNNYFPRGAFNTNAGLVHIVDIFGALDAILCKSILILKKKGLEILLTIGGNSSIGDWL